MTTDQEQTACIADLLGPKAEAKGGGCPCAECRAKREQVTGDRVQGIEEKAATPEPRHPEPDFKKKAAHDVENSDQ